jgi:hypothetical protein
VKSAAAPAMKSASAAVSTASALSEGEIRRKEKES